MAHTAAFFPTEMNIDTAVATVIIIAAITASAVVLGWLFTRLTPARRRDLVELARAIRRGSNSPE